MFLQSEGLNTATMVGRVEGEQQAAGGAKILKHGDRVHSTEWSQWDAFEAGTFGSLGARNRGRTCTALRPLAPKASASANSAIRAYAPPDCILGWFSLSSNRTASILAYISG